MEWSLSSNAPCFDIGFRTADEPSWRDCPWVVLSPPDLWSLAVMTMADVRIDEVLRHRVKPMRGFQLLSFVRRT